ncbi:hypothetical protein BH09SUM1_BH09SUM1_30990 [soil metagenome]
MSRLINREFRQAADKARLTRWLAWAVLFASVMVTLATWRMNRIQLREANQKSFTATTEQIVRVVRGRLRVFELVLRGAQGVYGGSGHISREDWRRYIGTLDTGEFFKGTQAFAYSEIIPADQKAAHLARVRAEGFSRYEVFPEGDRSLYAPVIYIEPGSEENNFAIGFDLYSDAIRREALEIAAESGQTTITGSLTLVQDAYSADTPGFLMLLPFYEPGAVIDTPAQRKSAVRGYFTSVFRARDYMDAVLGAQAAGIHVQLSDAGSELKPLLYDNGVEGGAPSPRAPDFHSSETLQVYNRDWTIQFSSLPSFNGGNDVARPVIILCSGLSISALLFAVVWTLANMRDHAVRIAEEMTQSLRASEAMLQETDARLNLALKSANVGTWNWRIPENAVAWDEYNHGLFGLKSGSFGGTIEAFYALIHEDDRPVIKASVERMLYKNEPVDIEFRAPWPDGSEHFIALRGELYRDENGKPLRMTGVCWDVTKRREAERTVHELNSELEQRVSRRTHQLESVNKQLEGFAYAASHDLKAPLRTVSGYVQLLHRRNIEALDAESLTYVTGAISGVEQMTRLINDLLSFSRVHIGVGRVLIDVPLNDAVDRALANLSADIDEAHAIITRSDLPVIRGELTLLTQLFQNLIGNGIKFVPAGRIPEIKITAERRFGEWIISVKDNGIGIDPKYSEKIFEIFKRLHTPSKYPGTGIGLAICKKIVESLSGRIWFESVKDEGATFLIALKDNPDSG